MSERRYGRLSQGPGMEGLAPVLVLSSGSSASSLSQGRCSCSQALVSAWVGIPSFPSPGLLAPSFLLYRLFSRGHSGGKEVDTSYK